MIFSHLAGGTFLFRLVFKDPGVDLRFLALGALLPDIVEWAVGGLVASGGSASVRLAGHSLAFSVGLLVAALALTRRRGAARKRAVVVAVGVISHLVLDLAWIDPQLLFWPVLGPGLPAGIQTDWSGFPGSFLSAPLRIGFETVGLAYLWWLARKARLGDPRHRAGLWRSGKLRT